MKNLKLFIERNTVKNETTINFGRIILTSFEYEECLHYVLGRNQKLKNKRKAVRNIIENFCGELTSLVTDNFFKICDRSNILSESNNFHIWEWHKNGDRSCTEGFYTYFCIACTRNWGKSYLACWLR